MHDALHSRRCTTLQEHSETVFTETYYELLQPLGSDALFNIEEWDQIVAVRIAVARALEKLRVDSLIGGSLDAGVALYCDENTQSLLSRLDDELRFLLITSEATVQDLSDKTPDAEKAELDTGELWIAARASEATKCGRCWHHRSDVGTDASHPELCARCVQNVEGDGEPRRFT